MFKLKKKNQNLVFSHTEREREDWLVAGFKADCHTKDLRPMGEMSRRGGRKKNTEVGKRNRGSNPAPRVCQLWVAATRGGGRVWTSIPRENSVTAAGFPPSNHYTASERVRKRLMTLIAWFQRGFFREKMCVP